jgi:hypothetical protein
VARGPVQGARFSFIERERERPGEIEGRSVTDIDGDDGFLE